MKHILLIISTLLITFNAIAQEPILGLIAKVEKDKVVLRWMPLDYKTWRNGNEKGYKLYRRTLYKNGIKNDTARFEIITPKVVKPLPQSSWEQFSRNNKFAKVAGKSLYEEKPTTDTISHDLNFAIAMQMSCMTQGIAKAMGLMYEDKNLVQGERYQYALMIDEKFTAFVEVNPTMITRLIPPDNLFGNFADSTFFMRWRVTDALMQTAFIVERSDDGGVNFKSIDINPTLISQEPDSLGQVFGTKSDKLPQFYQYYYYRVRAVTPFGELSEPSNILQVYGFRDRLPMPRLKSTILKKEVVLNWTFPDSLSRDIRGFEILRSKKLGEKYERLNAKILNRNIRTFVDSIPMNESYYRVAVINWVGKEQSSYPEFVQMDDTTPPQKPIFTYYKASQKGVVTLNWTPNKESDLLGYSVFMSNSKKTEFSLLTRNITKDTVFKDTLSLELLNKNIYYTLVAYDKRLNASIHSDTIIVKRPDILPPASPNFTNYTLTDSTIYLTWENSPSEDVIRTLLLRKADTDTSFTILGRFSVQDSINYFLDTKALQKHKYEYRLVVFDDSGLSNKEVCKINLSLFDEGFKPKIKDVTIMTDIKRREISFNWKYDHPDLEQFIIYRKKGKDGYLSTFKYLPKNFHSFVEKDVVYDLPYSYSIMATFKDGSESKLTDPINAIIPKPKE